MRRFVAAVLLLGLIAAVSAPVADGRPLTQSGLESSYVQLSYDAGLLNGRGTAVHLAAVLAKLGQVSGLQLEQRYVPTVEDRVSFRFKDEPVRSAVNDLLSGYNYFITGSGESGQTLKLILLGPVTVPEIEEPQSPTPIAVAPEPVQRAKQAIEDEPPELRGLDDYWSLARTEADTPAPETEGMPDARPSEDQLAAIESQQLQARLERVDRAAEVLASDYGYLHQDALADLQGIDDLQATATLRAASIGEVGSGGDLKAIAAESLWRHAADLGFADKQANQALLELAASADDNVRRIAKRALQDMDYHLMRQAEEEQAAEE